MTAAFRVVSPFLHMEAEHSLAGEFCRVERWRGYATCSFFARAPDGTLYESDAFRWRGEAVPPADARPRAAYDALVRRLERDGWQRHAAGTLWYETTFARSTPTTESGATPPARHAGQPPSEAPKPRRRSSRISTGAAACAVAVAAVAGVVLAVGRGSPAHSARPAAGTLAHRAVRDAGAGVFLPAPAPRDVDLRVAAERAGGSWIEARRGSRAGRILFAGVLVPGRRLHLRAPRLWVRFGAAGNLSITQDGKLVPLRGTYDKLFRPSS